MKHSPSKKTKALKVKGGQVLRMTYKPKILKRASLLGRVLKSENNVNIPTKTFLNIKL